MKIIFSHPTLNANAKAVVSGLHKYHLLGKLFTAVAIFKGQFLYVLSQYFLKDFQKRVLNKKWQSYTKTQPFYELGRVLFSKLKWRYFTTHESGLFCIDSVYQKQDHKVARFLHKKSKTQFAAVYAYEDGALHSFETAKSKGLQCFYDLPIGYWKMARKLLSEELENNPHWASTLTGFKDSTEKLNRKDAELTLADQIFVASTFTKKSLELYPNKLAPVQVIPYGFPEVCTNRIYTPLKGRKLKALFVGGLSQRKGISYMFEALAGLEDRISLTVVGHKADPNSEALNSALHKHTYIPSLAHQAVLELMRSQDVLLFPSLFEGFGLVITEAMSQGLPVITTNRTAGPDLITHRQDGWLVPAASSAAIKKVILEILKTPSLLETTGRNAMRKAENRPWAVYEKEQAEALKKLL